MPKMQPKVAKYQQKLRDQGIVRASVRVPRDRVKHIQTMGEFVRTASDEQINKIMAKIKQ